MKDIPLTLMTCIAAFDRLLSERSDEARILSAGREIMKPLLASDNWLDEAYAQPLDDRYAQYRLYLDPERRFSIVSFVWAPGQSTPIHDHTVWGIIGVLRGAELSRSFHLDPSGKPVASGEAERLLPGDISTVSPAIGDFHSVANALADRISISIHIYGADICDLNRNVFHPDGRRSAFRSTYTNGTRHPGFSL